MFNNNDDASRALRDFQNRANNPLNRPGAVNSWYDGQGNLNITVGGIHGLDHSHTVLNQMGQGLYDRNDTRNVFSGEPGQQPFFPNGWNTPNMKP